MKIKTIATIVAILSVGLFLVGIVSATPSPNGPGQPGAPLTTCGSSNTGVMPGNSNSALGSPFNPDGVAGAHYAGNLGTPSLEHSNSQKAVSQYDIACFQVTQNKP